MRRQRLQIGADLVAHVAAPRHAVATHDDQVDLPVLHQVAAGVVGHHRVWHACLAQFPRRQAGALVARPGFVDPHVHGQAGGMGLVNGRRGGAPAHRGQPAGVAVRQHVDGARAPRRNGMQQGQAVAADGGIHLHVFFSQRVGQRPGCIAALFGGQREQVPLHPLHRPGQVHGRGAGRLQVRAGGVEGRVRPITVGLQGHAISGRSADQRRAAQPHVADGGEHRLGAVQGLEAQCVRQGALVDHHHRVARRLRTQGAHRAFTPWHHHGVQTGAPSTRPAMPASRFTMAGSRASGAVMSA